MPAIQHTENSGLQVGGRGLSAQEDPLSDEPLEGDLQVPHRTVSAAHQSQHILKR